MAEMSPCIHGVPFGRLPDSSAPRCVNCELIWHETCLQEAKADVDRHQRKCSELIAEIFRTCGDA